MAARVSFQQAAAVFRNSTRGQIGVNPVYLGTLNWHNSAAG